MSGKNTPSSCWVKKSVPRVMLRRLRSITGSTYCMVTVGRMLRHGRIKRPLRLTFTFINVAGPWELRVNLSIIGIRRSVT